MAKKKIIEEKIETFSNEQHKKAISNGLYTMLTKEHQWYYAFWRIIAKASGFRAGELITLAYSNDVPSYPLCLRLFMELSTAICTNYKSNDVLWLCASKNSSFIFGVYDDLIQTLEFNTKSNVKNIIFGCDNTNKIINCIKQFNPKVIFIDNFQMLDGSQARNSEILSKICRQYNVCIVVLNELNNIKANQMPDITKISAKSGLLDRSDKVYIMWNSHQKWHIDEKGKRNKVYVVVCDLVKNRQSRLIREYLFFHSHDSYICIPIDSKIKKIENYIYEDYYAKKDIDMPDAAYSIASAINSLKREVDADKPFMVLKNGIIL